MADQFSFDVVSQIDLQEVDNAVNQALKEIRNRFDFKGSKSSIELDKEEKKIKLIADDDMKLRNLQDILRSRMAARKISSKALEFKEPEKAFEGTLRQEVTLVMGIAQDKAKEIVQRIKEMKLKVQPSIQGDQVRVSSKSKDELQAVITGLNQTSCGIPIQFVNYR
ncbi:MAG: YajQ family cyclic di-GMP-binding protein [Candidatus Omnitrophota bacterium]|jgi:hypothetical protein